MKLTVDTGEMSKASQALAQYAAEYTAIYTRLLNTASTMGDAWKDPANLAYVDQINGFCDDLKAMAAHIQQAAEALEQQATNYVIRSNDNTAVVKTLAN